MISLIAFFLLACSLLFACIRCAKAPVLAGGIGAIALIGFYVVFTGAGQAINALECVGLALIFLVLVDVYLRLRKTMELLTVALRKITLLEAQIAHDAKAGTSDLG